MPDRKISLFEVAKVLCVSMSYAKNVLEGENVMPLAECEELRFVVFWQSDVQSCFPEIAF